MPSIAPGPATAERLAPLGRSLAHSVVGARRFAASDFPAAATTAIVLLLASIAIRLPSFGNPMLHVDESFYLLVGDRMLHGALPYVDIWDRKPIGLFLIYAAIRLLGGDGILAYQIVAASFAGGTAFLIARIARPVAGEWPAAIAGLAYLLWIETIEGDGGQSPIFYNAFVAGAALLTLATLGERDPAAILRRGIGAMLVIGLAIQIKYTVAVEGLFFGLVLVARLQAAGRPLPRLLAETTAIATIALLPTLAAIAFYTAIGRLETFWFANFTSILLRSPPPGGALRLATGAGHLLPFAVCGLASIWWVLRRRQNNGARWVWFMIGWSVAALIGFASVGAYFFHYLLPVYVPFAALAAPILARWPIGPVLAALLLWLPAGNLNYPDFAGAARARASLDRVVGLLPRDVDRHCLFAYDGSPAYYLAGRACTLSRYVFPDHLSLAMEEHALGVDPVAEVKRILAQRPAAIAINVARLQGPDRPSFEPVRAALARDYHAVGQTRDDDVVTAVYVRN